jgi:3-hydroxybutyryl-CoA dehydrogenase
MSADAPTDERLAVIGSGTIACGLAATAARRGVVTMWARSDASAARAERSVHRVCQKLEDDAAAGRVSVTTDLGAVGDFSFAIEAIAEDLEAKRAIAAELGRRLDPDAVLATTTSSLSVDLLAQASGRPERYLGFHVFHPVPRMPLVELAFPAVADADTRARAFALCERLEKRPVEVPDSAGFVVNRLLFPFLLDAVRLIETAGLAPEDVDACMTLGAGHPMGPLTLLDFVGLDVSIAIAESIGVEVPERMRALVAEGALGRKAGRGFYTYETSS